MANDPRQYVSGQQIQDLWGAGFTIMRRIDLGDAAEFAGHVAKRHGMSLQWNDLRSVSPKWEIVPASRYEGIIAPYGTPQPEWCGLVLMERDTAEVEAFHKKNVDKAQKNVTNWAQAANGLGFTGDVTVARETSAGKEPVDFREIGSSSGPVVSQTNIPADMLDHLPAILKERDRLIAAERQKAGQQGYNFGGPAFKQTCTETAIATIRAREHAKLLERTSDAKKDNDGTAD